MDNTEVGISVGMIIPYASNGAIPQGFLLCNGAEVLVSTYPSLFAVIGYTYGGSGNKFRLPDLRDKFIEGNDVAGQYKDAGLPNIEGEFQSRGHARNQDYNGALTSGSGAFEHIRRGGGYGDNGVSEGSVASTNDKMLFDASRSNSIYGNSDTVQPPALTIRYIIRAFKGIAGSVKDVALTEVLNNVAIAVNQSAKNQDVADYVVETYSNDNGTSWYRRYKSGWLEQGVTVDKGSNMRDTSTSTLVQFPTAFKDSNYTSTFTPVRDGSGNSAMNTGINSKTPTSLCVHAYGNGTSDQARYLNVLASGFGRSVDATPFELRVSRYETRYQTITVTVNNVTYMNEQILPIYAGDVVTISTGGNWDYTGDIIVNGTNQNATSVTFTVSGNAIVTTTQPYDDDYDDSGDRG